MVNAIKVNFADSSNGFQLPGVSQDNFKPLSRYKLILKGLNCVLSWGELLLPAGAATQKLHGSRAALKLSASTFTIPKLMKKCGEVYNKAKKVQICAQNNPDNAKQIRKVVQAVASLFLSLITFVNKSTKVLFTLHKTKVIDLKRISTNTPEYLDQVSFVTSMPALYLSVRKLVSLIRRYCKAEEGSEERQGLRVKIAARSFKVFTSALGYASYFCPKLVPQPAALALSTISFGISLGKSLSDFKWEADCQSSIALKVGVI